MTEIEQIITDTGAYACLDCGKCTVVCPISQYNPDFSPRKIVYTALYREEADIVSNSQLWSCITCAMCEERCQSGVQYTELIKSLRAKAHDVGNIGNCTHGGALESLMHIMATDNLKQNRLDWLDKKLKTAVESDTFYFAGCQPYFDVIFSDLGVKTIDIAKSTVKILNKLGIVPALSPNERCCGHDLLWAGDVDNFVRLAEHNLKEISKSKAKRIVTACPECYRTLKYDYPRYLGGFDFDVVHISQLLAEAIDNNKLEFRRIKKIVTYHDPCRLGRISGIYEEPRKLINAIPGLELVEMPRNQANSLCCGTQAWINCGTINKQIQVERLREAKATGAEVLLTSCPKCQIHLMCAMNDVTLGKELEMKVEDITSLAARALRA